MSSLACYAVNENTSRGREKIESKPKFRDEFQRDRDRIIHSSSFRRLVYKTQVFVNHEGDLYRTRLTHSLEVSQIARTIAASLGLNETLVESIALAHDLGHTPFGHAGQDELNSCMSDFGGFEHNLQSLRIVDHLEKRYAEFRGLNLMFETREGILKHCSKKNAKKLGKIGERFLNRNRPSLEAQLADLADAISYNHHDIDDGYRAGILSFNQLSEINLFGKFLFKIKKEYPKISDNQVMHETLRRMVSFVIGDLIDNSKYLIDKHNPKNLDDVRNVGINLIQLSEQTEKEHSELKSFLRSYLYKNEVVEKMTKKAKIMIRTLFDSYMSENVKINDNLDFEKGSDPTKKARKIADYIAGMTDRFAISEYNRLS